MNDKKSMKNEEKEYASFIWEIGNITRGERYGNMFGNIYIALYLIELIGRREDLRDCSLDTLIRNIENTDVADYVQERYSDDLWKRIADCANRYNAYSLCKEMIRDIFDESHEATPESVCRLAMEILDIKSGETVADIGCGTGNFMVEVSKSVDGCHLHGFELNTRAKVVAEIRNEMLGTEANLYLGDVFSILEASDKALSFDKVFANYPFGLRIKMMQKGKEYLERLTEKIPSISKATSSDWVFNSLLVDAIRPTGRAAGIMTVGSAFNTIDAPARKYFVEKGLIEAVIALPQNVFYNTGIHTILVVLSHGNESIRFVDAREMCTVGRRYNTFSDEDISRIIEAYHTNGEHSKVVPIETIRENAYVLSPERYFSNVREYKNGVAFQDVILNITRGASIKAKDLDAIASEEPTQYQYLMLKNINNGVIDANLPYITEIAEKHEKYCIRDNNLILSKNGYPYKVAIASVPGDKMILASGNMYVIELDEDKVDPYYIKAFLESEQGINVLKSITVGATIPNIGVESLRKVKIPLPDMEVQQRIALRYKATLDEIAVLQIKQKKAQDRLLHIFDEESEG